MKKILLLAFILNLPASSWGQNLIWSKTISAPSTGAIPNSVYSASKNPVSCAVLIKWISDSDDIQQVLWFGAKGTQLHSEILFSGSSDTNRPDYYIYGISSSRLTLLTYNPDNMTMSYNPSFMVFTLKPSKNGRVIEKASFSTQALYAPQEGGHADNTGFITIENTSGDTWVIKRYIY